MAFSHVIFDLDGTVLDTLTDLADAGNHVCAEHGWPTYSVDAYRYKVGNGMLKLVERFMPAEFAGNAALFEQALGEFRAFYAEHKDDTTAPYPGTLEMLDELADEMSDRIVVAKCNVDENQDLAMQYGVMSIPTLVMLKGGKEAMRTVGAVPKPKLVAEVEAAL